MLKLSLFIFSLRKKEDRGKITFWSALHPIITMCLLKRKWSICKKRKIAVWNVWRDWPRIRMGAREIWGALDWHELGIVSQGWERVIVRTLKSWHEQTANAQKGEGCVSGCQSTDNKGVLLQLPTWGPGITESHTTRPQFWQHWWGKTLRLSFNHPTEWVLLNANYVAGEKAGKSFCTIHEFVDWDFYLHWVFKLTVTIRITI